MSNQIVTVNVSQQVGSAPSLLQQTGAIISQGGTTLAANHTALITQPSDLTAILAPSLNISSLVWSASPNEVTVTTSSAHGIATGQTVQATIANAVPSGYNGTFACTATGTTTLTYPLTTNPGTETTPGTFTLASVAEVLAAVTTFFAQGTNLAVYVLELGAAGTASGVTSLTAYINAPTIQMYAYLLPPAWDSEATAYTMAANYASPTSELYFYVTTTISTFSNWGTHKSVFAVAQSPSAPVTELSAAAPFWLALNDNPSASNLVSPMEYSFVYGVTPYVLTNAQQTTLNTGNVSWINTGAQGQISNTLIQGGNFLDGNPFNYWYATDWMAIQEKIALSAAVINGSNTPQNPLYYNQAGINNLQKVAQNVANNAVAFGLVLAGVTVTATPFATYITQNPSDYAAGIYRGLACTFTPQRGFAAITIYLTASNIPV